MAVMTTMVACFNQEVELKKETVRKDTRALMLGPQMVTWPRYSKDLRKVAGRLRARSGGYWLSFRRM